MTTPVDQPIGMLLDLPASTLHELAAALREGSLRYGISAGLLSPFCGEKAPDLALALASLVSKGCSIAALATICEELASSRAVQEKFAAGFFLTLSGPDIPGVPVVDTRTVVRALFEEARREVLITSYVFHDAADLLSPLVERCRLDSSFRVRFVVDLSHARRTAEEPLPVIAGRFRMEFLSKFWPDAPSPEIWHDPRVFEMEDRTQAGVMHAKVVVIDESAALITSANFTSAAQTRNIEAGMLTRNRRDIQRLNSYFEGLITLGHLKQVR